MFEVFSDMQQERYVHSNMQQTSVKATVAKHAVEHVNPSLLSRGNTFVLSFHRVTIVSTPDFVLLQTFFN